MPGLPGRIVCAVGAALLACGLVPRTARADSVMNGRSRTEILDCAGAGAVINGDANHAVFHGNCRSLRIDGTNNVVEIDLAPGGGVTISGGGNQVRYTPIVPGPVIAAEGAGNSVNAASGSVAVAPHAIAPPDTVVLRGDGQRQDVACGGRNVLIEGSHGSFVLRGGCLSLTVRGHADTVRAELVPAAPVSIAGDAVTLHYTLTGTGPAPEVSVNGNQATVGAAAQ